MKFSGNCFMGEMSKFNIQVFKKLGAVIINS
jgi:hypothetical protein